MHFIRRSKTSFGFTLVELAIAIVIISLLVMGVFSGQELIRQATFSKAIKDVQSYKTAIFAFQSKYGQLPGDFDNALSFFPTCKEDSFYTCNGNGDGVIGLKSSIPLNDPENHFEEGIMIWRHLSLSGLIKGDYNITDTMDYFGGDSPAFKLPDGPDFYIIFIAGLLFSTAELPTPDKDNIMLFLNLEGSDKPSCDSLADFDAKIDDGKYNSGDMRTYASDIGFDQCSDIASGDGSYYKDKNGFAQFSLDPKL